MKCPSWITPSLFVVVSLSLLLAVSMPGIGQDAKPASVKPSTGKPNNESADKADKAWICPMCPQIHQHDGGRCPICSMALVPVKRDDLMMSVSLDQMLTVAMKHNPDIRAAQARLLAADAELDRTRLTVLQTIIAYRERWSAQKASLVANSQEVEAAQEAAARGNLSDAQRKQVAAMLAAAKRKLAFEQARLREVEAELPFLLGRQNSRADDESADAGTAVIKDRLIPMIEQLIELSTEEYRKGQADLSDMISWSQRLAELKVQTTSTKTEQIKIVEAHITLLKDMQKMADQRYKTGTATLKDVLTAQIQVAEAELWLAKIKSSAR